MTSLIFKIKKRIQFLSNPNYPVAIMTWLNTTECPCHIRPLIYVACRQIPSSRSSGLVCHRVNISKTTSVISGIETSTRVPVMASILTETIT